MILSKVGVILPIFIPKVLGWQIAGLGTIILWAAVTSALLFGGLRLLGILRVPEEVEIKGI
jgi:Amt family ammonium transporter